MEPTHNISTGWKTIGKILIFLLAFWLNGCNLQYGSYDQPDQTAPLFVPQKQTEPSVIPTIVPAHDRPKSSPSISCTNNLTFISDLTIPDKSVIDPGTEIDKRWQVQNSGTCNWDEKYTLRLTEGSALGTPEIIPLFPARGGEQLEIQMIFIAPTEPGRTRTMWQAYDPQGQPFGDPIYMDIIIAEK